MKKLKIGLILAFSMLLTLGLAACGGNSSEETHNITSIKVSDGNSIELIENTDASKVQAAFTEAVNEKELRVYADNAREVMTGDQFTWNIEGVTWTDPGTYNVIGTPNFEEGYALQNGNNISVTLEVNINHNFGEPDANGVRVCPCGAKQSTRTFDPAVKANYNSFHGGYVSAESTTDDDGFIRPFGTVTTNSGSKEVLTYTVGTLNRGMTISVSGTGTNENNTAATWYFPILGVGVRNFDSSVTSDSNYTFSTAASDVGASVLVRNDGWVLMDGIGSDRLLTGFAGGPSAATNYTSIVSTMPAASDMAAWKAYSTGTPCYSAEYTGDTAFTFTWSFSDEGIIEITFNNETAGAVLVTRIRVPDGINSVDTIAHGEFFNMSFTSMTVTEMNRLAAARVSFADNAEKVNYVEGENLNFDDISVEVSYENAPSDFTAASGFTLQAYTGDKTTQAEVEADTAAEHWTEIAQDTPLSSAYKFFRVRVLVGSTAQYDYLTVGDNFIDSIEPNDIDTTFGTNYTLSGVVYENKLAFNEIGYGSYTAEGTTYVNIAPTGTANRMPAAVSGYGYFISLRIWAKDGAPFGNSATVSDGSRAFVNVANDGAYADVLVYLGADASKNIVTIAGLQETPVRLDLSGVSVPEIAVTLSAESVPVNVGGNVTVTYNIPDLALADFQRSKDLVSIGIGTLYSLGRYNFVWNGTNTAFEDATGIAVGNMRVPVSGSVAANGDGMTLTVTYHIPAAVGFNSDHPGYYALNLMYEGTTLTDNVYYGAPDPDGTAGTILKIDGVDVWVNASGASVYYVVLGMGDGYMDVVDASVDVPEFTVVMNAGENTPQDMLRSMVVNVGLGMANGEMSYADSVTAGNSAFTGALRVFGTANMNRDVDLGWIVTGSLNAENYGVNTSGDANGDYTYYFQVLVGDTAYLYRVSYTAERYNEETWEIETPSSTAITLVENPSGTPNTPVLKGTCDDPGITATAITVGSGDEAEAVFYYDIVYSPAHDWQKTDDHYVFKCADCGAILNSTIVNATGAGNANPSGGTTVSAKDLGDVSTTGLTVSFWIRNAASDWDDNVLATVAGNLQITLPNLQGNVKSATKPEGVSESLWTKLGATNMFPSNAGTLYSGNDYNTFFTTTGVYATVVVDPGEEATDGIRFYKNGVLVLEYKATAKVDNITVGEFVELFLQCAEVKGIVINSAKFAASWSTDDMIFQNKVLTADEVSARYGNYLVENEYYPDNHNWVTDQSAEGYGFCSICDSMNPNHVHIYVTDTSSNKYDHCTVCDQLNPSHSHVWITSTEDGTYDHCIGCGVINPNHGNTANGGQAHVYRFGRCIACQQADPNHTEHTFVNGVCECTLVCSHEFKDGVCSICGATQTTQAVTDASYTNPTVWAADGTYLLPIKLAYGTPITINGTMTGAVESNWHTALIRLGSADYTIRFDAYIWGNDSQFENSIADDDGDTVTSKTGITNADGSASALEGDPMWAAFRAICAQSNWSVTLSWVEAGTLEVTVIVTSTAGEYKDCVFTCVYSIPVRAEYTETMDVRISGEVVSSFSVTGYSTLTYPSAN